MASARETPDCGVVAVSDSGSFRGSAPGRRDSKAEAWAEGRRLYLDNLKVVLIAAIIALHGVLSYVGSDRLWSYADVQEVTLNPAIEAAVIVVAGPFALLMIPLLFLVAGLLTPGSLERKGVGRFARDRLLRLGVPFFVFVLMLQPMLMYALYHPFGAAPGSYWEEFLSDEGELDAGPLWFVGVLLIFSLPYAGWVRWRPPYLGRHETGEITARHLALLAAAVALLSFLVRVVYSFGSESGFWDLNLWEWPACFALFMLGIAASARGWLDAVPDQLRRLSRATTLVTVVVLAGFVGIASALGVEEHLWGGWHWAALVFAALESVLAVFGPVWLLGVAQRYLGRRIRWAGPAISRSAYAAFMLQGFVLIGLAVALRPLPVPAEVKALVLATGGVAGSFALAWLVIRRVPYVGRIL